MIHKQDIAYVVEEITKVPFILLRAKTREQSIVRARALFAWLMRKHMHGVPFRVIEEALDGGQANHLHNKAQDLMVTDSDFKQQALEASKMLVERVYKGKSA